MLVKNFLVTISLVLLATTVSAQVYYITPVYEIKSIELSKTDLHLYSVDSFSRGTFIVDLDNMIFTDPVTSKSTPSISTIKKVTRISDNLLMFKIKKEYSFSVGQFYLKLDGSGKPIYIQSDDEIIKTYTSNGNSINLYSECSRMKKAVVPYTEGAKAPDDLLNPALTAAVVTDAYNSFELKDGGITWTEGKGKNAVVHHITISESKVSSEKNVNFLQFTGTDAEGNKCNVIFYHSNRSPYNYIKVEKIENNTWASMFMH